VQALERCQLKDVVDSKAQKLDALGLLLHASVLFFVQLSFVATQALNMFSELVSDEEVLRSCQIRAFTSSKF
jgi:hypothetical protein